MSVNVSVIQLLRDDLQGAARDDGRDEGKSGKCRHRDKSAFTWDFEALNRALRQLRDAGLQVAIDDFGTGYSSLARERELNVNCLKIAKYFVDKLMHLKPEEAITRDVISMAHWLGHFVVAEGVEHERQRQCLLDYGCDRIQGNLVSRPLDEDAAAELLRKHANS